MTKTVLVFERGTGTALRSGSYTKAACRAVQNALWHNSINIAELFGAQKSDMMIDVEIACQDPNAIDVDDIAVEFPYGQITVSAVQGGLDIAHPDMPERKTIIAHAAIKVSLDLIAQEA